MVEKKSEDRVLKSECGSWKVKHRAKSIAQRVQKVENKRITTEGHGATRKDTAYKFVASVHSFILMDRIHSFDPPEADHSTFDIW